MKKALSVILLFLMLAVPCGYARPRGLPAQEGILNFGKITDNLFRGAQPDAAALKRLKELGIKSIINLRSGKAGKAGVAQASMAGILCTNIPMSGMGRPSDQQVKAVLAAIESLPGPLFIHCQHGCDRTGTIVACYRIQHDGWSSEEALREAERYGLSSLERGMKAYVIDFAKSQKPK
jgi:protein tyrosine/serine phosphatase